MVTKKKKRKQFSSVLFGSENREGKKTPPQEKKKKKTYPVITYTKDSWRKWEGGGLFNRLRVNTKGISLCWQGIFEAMSTQTDSPTFKLKNCQCCTAPTWDLACSPVQAVAFTGSGFKAIHVLKHSVSEVRGLNLQTGQNVTDLKIKGLY